MNRLTSFLAAWPDPSALPLPPAPAPMVGPSGSSYANTTIYAQGWAALPSSYMGYSPRVSVELSRELDADHRVTLRIESGDVVGAENDAGDAVLELGCPDALRALTSALLELLANPNAWAILASIEPAAPDPADDDDDDDGTWKRGAAV